MISDIRTITGPQSLLEDYFSKLQEFYDSNTLSDENVFLYCVLDTPVYDFHFNTDNVYSHSVSGAYVMFLFTREYKEILLDEILYPILSEEFPNNDWGFEYPQLYLNGDVIDIGVAEPERVRGMLSIKFCQPSDDMEEIVLRVRDIVIKEIEFV